MKALHGPRTEKNERGMDGVVTLFFFELFLLLKQLNPPFPRLVFCLKICKIVLVSKNSKTRWVQLAS